MNIGGSGIPYWDFTGSTLVTNKFVRLTSDTQSQAGSLWSTIVRFSCLVLVASYIMGCEDCQIILICNK